LESAIPTYASDGRRLRRYTLEAIERLEQLDLVAVQRNRKGRIVCAHFRPQDGANPISNAAHTGTRYSFEESLPSGCAAWTHRALERDPRALATLFGESADDSDQAELFVRAIFRAVPLSCMKRTESKTSAKVVSIDAGRRRPKMGAVNRPIEFDSERRIA